MSKIFKIFVIFALFYILFANFNICNICSICRAEELDEQEDTLYSEVERQLDNIDFNDLEQLYDNMDDEVKSVLGYDSFNSFVRAILNGEENLSIESVINYILSSFKKLTVKLLPTIMVIVAIAFIYNIFSKMVNSSIKNIVYLICFVTIVLSVFVLCKNSIVKVKEVILSVRDQMNLVFPILLTLMTAIGGVTSVTIYKPVVSFLSVLIVNVCSDILIPIVLYILVFTIAGNLNENVKLTKFIDLLKSVFKWCIGLCTSVYLIFLSVKCVSASLSDGVSIRATRYAIKNYIPYLGNFLSEGVDVIHAGSVLLKNSIGVGAVLMLLVIVILPLVELLVLSMLLKFGSGVLEPLSDGKISNFLTSLAKCMEMLVACLSCVGFMYFITILLMIGSANTIV